MKTLLIPLLALSACLAVCPSGLSNDLPPAPQIEQIQITPLDVILDQSDYQIIVMVEFDAAAPAMHKNIIAKLHCESVITSGDSQDVKFRAVSDDSEENKSFSKWTPSATLEMNITNPAALGAFEAGRDYLVTITEAKSVPAPA